MQGKTLKNGNSNRRKCAESSHTPKSKTRSSKKPSQYARKTFLSFHQKQNEKPFDLLAFSFGGICNYSFIFFMTTRTTTPSALLPYTGSVTTEYELAFFDEEMRQIAQEELETLGMSEDTAEELAKTLQYSLGYSQGDGVSFGNYTFEKKDHSVFGIPETWENPEVFIYRIDERYAHKNTFRIEIVVGGNFPGDEVDDKEKEILLKLQGACDAIEKRGYEQLEAEEMNEECFDALPKIPHHTIGATQEKTVAKTSTGKRGNATVKALQEAANLLLKIRENIPFPNTRDADECERYNKKQKRISESICDIVALMPPSKQAEWILPDYALSPVFVVRRIGKIKKEDTKPWGEMPRRNIRRFFPNITEKEIDILSR